MANKDLVVSVHSILFFYVFSDSTRAEPRDGGVLELARHLDVVKDVASSFARSQCDAAEMDRSRIRLSAGKSCRSPGGPRCAAHLVRRAARDAFLLLLLAFLFSDPRTTSE